MRIAIIDLGTNSVRFDVQRISNKSEVTLLHRDKLLIRLGQGVFLSGQLQNDAMNRAIQAFQSFSRTAKALHVDRYVAFATSALRDAKNGDTLVQKIKKATGIEVRIISGKEEATLIAEGILENEKTLDKLTGSYALVDIGGGSTEISLCRKRDAIHSHSFDLGTARLQQVYLKSSPPTKSHRSDKNPIKKLRQHIKGTLLAHFISQDWPKVKQVVGSSGTIKALGKILGKSKSFRLKELSQLVEKMSSMTTSQLLDIPRMEAKRVDMILAGAILLEETMLALGANEVAITEFSLRDGILCEELNSIKNQHKAYEIQLDYFRAKAKQLGHDLKHPQHVQKLCMTLFDKIKIFQKLDTEHRDILAAAALMHDIGKVISTSSHHEHSYYIVSHIDAKQLSVDQCRWIANLCLFHNCKKFQNIDTSWIIDSKQKKYFQYLLAILLIADALDHGHQSAIKIKSALVKGSKIELSLEAKGATDLERLHLEQKAPLLEQLLTKQVYIK